MARRGWPISLGNVSHFWNHAAVGEARLSVDTSSAFHGLASQRIELLSGTAAAVTNRGLGNEGLAFQVDKEYDARS